MTPISTRLRERKLFQWGVAYLADGWLLLQVLGRRATPGYDSTTLCLAETRRGAIVRTLKMHSFRAALTVATLVWTCGAQAQGPAELLIRRATIVTEGGRLSGDIRIREGLIAEIGANLRAAPGAREIDARGLVATPGGIDPHVHLSRSRVDDYTSGSAAALAGGITTISNFLSTDTTGELAGRVRQEAELIRAEAIADVIFHSYITEPARQEAQIPSLAVAGQPSVKFFMNQAAFDQNARGYIAAMETAGRTGVLTMIHAEDDAIVWHAQQRLLEAGRGSLRFFSQSRPILAEVIATRRAVAMSEATGAPVYLVHLSSEAALRVAEEARGRGLPIFVETRPIYLHLTAERFQEDAPGLYVGNPALRARTDQDALWSGLASGAIDVVASDHLAYTRAEKLDSTQNVTRHRAGMSNLQEMLPMLYSEGVVAGRITLEQFVAVTSANPARLFGLYPRKGIIAVGSDADIVLWDPGLTRTIRDDAMLSRSGYSTYSGRSVTGWPRVTIRRGEVVFEDGRITGKAGSGRLIPRGAWQAPRALCADAPAPATGVLKCN